MKRKFSKILGVGVTLALLTSLLLTAAPVAALSAPSVTFPTAADAVISTINADYTIRFQLGQQLTGGTTVTDAPGAYELAEIGDSFVITANAGGDTATFTFTAGTVAVAMSGAGGYVSPTITFAAAGEVATVTVATVSATTGRCNGTWARTGTPTAAVTVGAAADTITIVFPSDTAVTTTPTATIVAAPGWINEIWASATTSAIAPVGTVATRTVVVTLTAGDRIGEGAEVRIAITAGVTNPSTIGSYYLTVATSKETTAVTSAAYSITAPIIPTLAGIVSVYNPAGVLMTQTTGGTAIATAIDYASITTGWVIKIGPGTYTENPTTGDAGVTFVATGTKEETIITGTFTINQNLTTLNGLTITGRIVGTGATNATIKNCVLKPGAFATLLALNAASTPVAISNTSFAATGTTVTAGITIASGATVTVTDSTFTVDADGTDIVSSATSLTVTNSTFTGAGAGIVVNTGTTSITGSTFDGLVTALDINDGTVSVSSSTIKNSTGNAIDIAETTTTVVKITGNNINTTAATFYGIIIASSVEADTDVFVLFNNISNTLNIKNEDDATLNATHNWWGAATGPAAASISDLVNTSGYLGGAVTPGAAAINFNVTTFATGISSLTAATTAKVDVSASIPVTGAPKMVTIIGAANYAANPQGAAPATAIAGGFFDVYAGAPVSAWATGDEVLIKLYGAVKADTVVYAWSPLTGTWALCTSQGISTFGGYGWVKVTTTTTPALTDLIGTPFVLVTPPAVAPTLAAPTISAPLTGEKDVSLRPTFAWTPVPGAAAYYFELADNPNFVVPLMKLDGDMGRLIVTAYQHMIDLEYSTSYYWRVKAVSGTVLGKDLVASTWTSGVFITEAEPVVEVPPAPVWTCPLDGLTFDTREALEAHVAIAHPPVEPIVIPAEKVITPGWIYAIIGVGAVLVIAVIVLIVGTRRAA